MGGRIGSESSPYFLMPLQEIVDVKRERRMAKVDAFDPATRSLVHEYGLTVVTALREVGVTKPSQIKHIVETVLNEFSPTRGSYSKQGRRTEIEK
jgi:hypothetical protein